MAMTLGNRLVLLLRAICDIVRSSILGPDDWPLRYPLGRARKTPPIIDHGLVV